jgi:hypothetical protein
MDKHEKYEATDKGKAARARSRANQKEKREAARDSEHAVVRVSRKDEHMPEYLDYAAFDRREKSIAEANRRVWDDHVAHGRSGQALVCWARWKNEELDRIEPILKKMGRDPRTTLEERDRMCKALQGASDRMRAKAIWLRGKETREQRINRIILGVWVDGDDRDFMKDLLLSKLSEGEA